MQYKQKNFLMSALVAVLGFALVTASGCDTEGDNKGKDDGKTKDVTVTEWSVIPDDAFGSKKDLNHLTLGGNKWLYVTSDAGKKLFGADASDFAKLSDKKTWNDVGLVSGLDDTAGKGELLNAAGTNAVNNIVPTAKGVFVSVTASDTDESGAYYIEGKTYKAGWGAINKHMVGGVANGHPVVGLVATKAGKEYPVILDVGGATGAIGGAATTTLDAPAVLNKVLSRATTVFNNFASGKVVGTMGTKDFYLVEPVAINTLAEADIGGTADKGLLDSAGLGAPYKAAAWGTVANLGAANDHPASIHFDKKNKKLYVGFEAAAGNKGGVIVFDEDKKTTAAPSKDWKGISVVGFAEDKGGKVWAVTAKALVEVKSTAADVTLGDKLDNAKDKSMPADNINGAAWVGDSLIVTTSDAGAHLMIVKKQTVKE